MSPAVSIVKNEEKEYGRKRNTPEMEAGGSVYNPGDWRYRLFSFDEI